MSYIPLHTVRKVYTKSERQFWRDKRAWIVKNNKVLLDSLPIELQRILVDNGTDKNKARLKIIKEYKKSGLSVVTFCETYNKGFIQLDTKVSYPTISHMTLYRWLDSIYSDEAKNKESGFGRCLTDDDKNIIKQLYFNLAKWSVAKVYREWQTITGNNKISYRTVKRYLDSLPPIMQALREGGKYLNDKFMPFLERDYTQYKPMDLWVSDHHQFDFFVKDKNRVYRPYLTAFMDMRSRKIVGYHISTNPSSYTILKALEKGITTFGVPNAVLFDNGRDYKSKRLQGTSIFTEGEKIKIEGVFDKLKVKVHFCEPYHGQSKPIERWFRTVCEDFSKTVSSYVGSNTKITIEEKNRNYKNIKEGIKITTDDIEDAFSSWVEQYNSTAHTGNGMYLKSPNEVFSSYYKHYVRIDLNKDYRQLLFAKEEWHKINRNGIKFEGINYWDVELVRLQGNKKYYRVVRDIDDISKVYVYDKDGNFICDAYNNYIGQGKTEEDIKEVKKKRKIIKQVIKVYKSVDLKGNTLEEQLHNMKSSKEDKQEREIKKASGFSYWQ